jgi:hypothetical protein
VELRRRMAKGLFIQANYTFAKGLNLNSPSFLRPWVKSLGATLPHALKMNWMYELPIGGGKMLFGSSHGALDKIIGGWEFQGTARLQSGNILDYGNVRLVGMTLTDLKNSVGLRFDDAKKLVYYVPQDIIDNTYKAYSYNATTAGGFTSGAPTGRYIAPANSGGNCIQIASGDCAPYTNFVRGPGFMRFDLSLVKRIRFSESKNFELRGEFLNAFNNINFTGVTCTSNSATCGQVNSAFRDTNQQQDPGGRLIQLVARINF